MFCFIILVKIIFTPQGKKATLIMRVPLTNRDKLLD